MVLANKMMMEFPKTETAVFQTCYEMMQDRGYKIVQQVLVDDNPFFWRLHGHSPLKGKIVVVCVTSPSRDTPILVSQLDVEFDTLILVGKRVAPVTRLLLTKEGIEVFSTSELVLNPCRLQIAPTYSLLSAEEKEEMLQRLSITEDNIPIIKATDKAVRYLGFKAGDVFKTTSKFTGIVNYQVVKQQVTSESYKPVKHGASEAEAEGLVADVVPKKDEPSSGESDESGDDEISADEEGNEEMEVVAERDSGSEVEEDEESEEEDN